MLQNYYDKIIEGKVKLQDQGGKVIKRKKLLNNFRPHETWPRNKNAKPPLVSLIKSWYSSNSKESFCQTNANSWDNQPTSLLCEPWKFLWERILTTSHVVVVLLSKENNVNTISKMHLDLKLDRASTLEQESHVFPLHIEVIHIRSRLASLTSLHKFQYITIWTLSLTP